MIKKSNIDFKELNFTLYFLAFLLVFIGLTGLNSISQQYDEKFLTSPFIKQIILLIPSIIFSLIVLVIPKIQIHKYVYHLYFFGIILVILPFLFGYQLTLPRQSSLQTKDTDYLVHVYFSCLLLKGLSATQT